MKSNYKRIGDYIRVVDKRNSDLNVENLLGLSITKEFVPSVANTVGTDMSKYKIVKRNQFVCSTMQVRRDKKMPVALLQHVDEGIISPAYYVFEVIDESILLPEYLMMWFSRTEFDREACFYAIGGVRGSLEWEDFCDMKLSIPSIEKQREIVEEYNTILNRIKLNKSILDKLEELAMSIYKKLFVNFELHNCKNKIYNEEIDQYIPDMWSVVSVKEYCTDMKSGGTPNRGDEEFWNSKDIPWLKTGEIFNNIIIDTEEYISENGLNNSSAKILPKDTVLMSMYGVNAGQLGILKIESSTNQACCGMICSNNKEAAYLYYTLLYKQEFISSQSIGGAQENLSKNFIENIKIIKPSKEIIDNSNLDKIINYRELLTREIKIEKQIIEILLAKLANMGD